MKKIFFILLIFNILQSTAQTNVVHISTVTLPQNYISYFLPQTEILVEVSVKHTIQRPGRFANYAKRLLALNNVITSKSEKYELEKININYNVIPDTLKNFAVEINPKSTAYNLYLSENRIIKGVNASNGSSKDAPLKITEKVVEENIDTTILFNYSVLSEDALMAISDAKMAEMAAKQIFKIRESRMEILSGESETEYKGDALQLVISELGRIEKELIALFEGKSITFIETKIFRFIPKSEVKNEIIFRFSPLLGIVEKDDLAGRAISMSVLPQYIDNQNNTEKTVKKFGIYYNVSLNAQITIFDGNRQLAENNFLIPQFGTLKFLPAELFNNKTTQVLFTEFGDVEVVISR